MADTLGNDTESNQLSLRWDRVSQADWDRLMARPVRSSLEQSWAYGTAVAKTQGCRVRRAIISSREKPLAILQVFEKRRFIPLTIVQAPRGSIWLDSESTNPEKQRAVYRLIKNAQRLRQGRLLFWTPELADTPESAADLRAAGLRRVVTGYSSAWLDLTQPCDALRGNLLGKWRNALHQAEQGALRVEAAAGGKQLEWLIDGCDAFRRRRGFVGLHGGLIRAYAESGAGKNDVLVLTAFLRNVPVATILLLRHGQSATYTLGHTTPEGRQAHAHHLLLWRSLTELQNRDVAWLDFVGINTVNAPGVARFKLGLGGQVFTLTGTYL